MNQKNTYLGIELGSTRIKAILTDNSYQPVASGNYEWENAFENGYWTYSFEAIHNGVKECFKDLKKNYYNKYNEKLSCVGAIGISAMMHGYLALDKNFKPIVPFRTWRNTTTEKAAKILTDTFDFNIPQRWSIAHLYQAILNDEPHIKDIYAITTLAGYIHHILTGNFEVGIGDASGIFPIKGNDYDDVMLDKFDELIKDKNYDWKIKNILPKVRLAGTKNAYLTQKGAEFLDPSGDLEGRIAVCPPEGDAGTGMVATNSIEPKTGNISAGTSIFSMLVLEKPLKKHYPQIDMVTTPEGSPVAMVHCNNCCGELDTWVNIFSEFASLLGSSTDKSKIYELLYNNAKNSDCNGIVAYNYLSGEHVGEIQNGHPMYFRNAGCKMNLASFIKAELYSSFSTLMLGMRILFENENVKSKSFLAHGGLFKTQGVAQQMISDALNTPISVMETAGEGGAWGMSLLAAYMMNANGKSLKDWLKNEVFTKYKSYSVVPNNEGTKEFSEYLKLYESGLEAQRVLHNV